LFEDRIRVSVRGLGSKPNIDIYLQSVTAIEMRPAFGAGTGRIVLKYAGGSPEEIEFKVVSNGAIRDFKSAIDAQMQKARSNNLGGPPVRR
jgi:hypothetical protein